MRYALIFAFALLAPAGRAASTSDESNSICPCDGDIQDLQSQVSTLDGQKK